MDRSHPRASAVGIDFGTTNTVVSIRRSGTQHEPQLFDGTPLLPSAVFADPGGELLVGADAVERGRRRPAAFDGVRPDGR